MQFSPGRTWSEAGRWGYGQGDSGREEAWGEGTVSESARLFKASTSEMFPNSFPQVPHFSRYSMLSWKGCMLLPDSLGP